MNEFQVGIINVYMLFQYRKKMNKIIVRNEKTISKYDAKHSYYLNYPELVSEEFWKKYMKKIKNIIKVVGLEGAKHKYPSYLSGGMQQRVALVRAIVIEPFT
jgi:ABC-type lipoprotein export system ATPase subunit